MSKRKTQTPEERLRDLRSRMTALDKADRETRARIVALEASIEAAAESAALTGETAEVSRLRDQQAKLQAELVASADVRQALARLLTAAEQERAAELDAIRGEQVQQAGEDLAQRADTVHEAIARLAEACQSYLAAADSYSAIAGERDRDCKGHPLRVRESLRGVLTVELRGFAAAPGSIPAGPGKMPSLYGSTLSRGDWLAA